ncbi:BlaI/MecI/CopY family transcriptional regulator [Candidatus Bathyarchaeota archaeon]|nr:BlaI/MecI/CopY family transcriptional regulator [Candidatus Bathyarchaeota archaeon]
MAGFKFDHEKEGLGKTLKEYEEFALRYVWSIGEKGVGSGKTWAITNERLGPDKTISRASVIFFLNRMVNQGVLSYRTATGKGGHHRVYYPLLDEKAYKKHLLKTIVESLMRDFPDETREALGELQSLSA